MNPCRQLFATLLFALATTGAAAAIPKAAEDASATVTTGADAPKPKKANPANNNPTEKKRTRKAGKGR